MGEKMNVSGASLSEITVRLLMQTEAEMSVVWLLEKVLKIGVGGKKSTWKTN
jgi:hypothetical protein